MTSGFGIFARNNSVASMAQNISENGAVPSQTGMGRAEFAALVEEHQARLRGFLFRYTRNQQDAEDLTQDTFVKAYRNIHRYDSKYSFSPWLYTIARRTAYNHFRDKKPTEALEYDVVESSDAPDEEASQDDERNWVWKATSKLKPDFREALTLKYVDDLSIEEISKIMGKTQTNVKIILFRARNQLKKMKKAEGKEFIA